MELEKRFENFLRQQILVERDAGPVVSIELRHLPTNDKKGFEVSYLEPPSNPDDEWFKAATIEILSQAESDAAGLGKIQAYVVLLYRKKNPKKIAARHAFRIQSDDYEEAVGYDSEPATLKGLVSQLMRHNEVLAKSSIASFASIMASNQRTIDRLSARNESLENRHLESFQVYEELISLKQDRELKAIKAENREQIIKDLAGEVKMLAPAVLNNISKKKNGKSNSDLTLLQAKKLFDSLTAEQVKELKTKLMDTKFTSSQQITLMELIKNIQELQDG